MTSSADLTRSRTWERFGPAIAAKRALGQPWRDVMEVAAVINLDVGLTPYIAHAGRLQELLWHDDPTPKTIIDLGAGYGAMASVWPPGSRVINVDLPEMLEIQREYVASIAEGSAGFVESFAFIPFTEADRVPVDGAYLFSAWALTETTRATWDYWIERAPRLAGAYILGHKAWEGGPNWPWDLMLRAFGEVRAFNPVVPDSWELAAVNR